MTNSDFVQACYNLMNAWEMQAERLKVSDQRRQARQIELDSVVYERCAVELGSLLLGLDSKASSSGTLIVPPHMYFKD